MVLIRWILIFLICALIASMFGFHDAAAGFSEIVRVLLFIFVLLADYQPLFRSRLMAHGQRRSGAGLAMRVFSSRSG
jgi:uncharacterized membrane protein YtjA (UPF0391 family)